MLIALLLVVSVVAVLVAVHWWAGPNIPRD
jgi:hypothetical protein